MEIIITVEKGYRRLPDFLLRLREDVDKGQHSFHFIAGTLLGETVLEQLESFCGAHSNVYLALLEGLPNRYECANAGFAVTHGDVIIVSPDVLLVEGWIEALAGEARQMKGLATLTPMSNALPEGKDLPLPYTPQELGALVSQLGGNGPIAAPFAHGNCRFISREAIVATSGYDAAFYHSPTGYEADFAWRAQKAGFLNYVSACLYLHAWQPVGLVGEKRDVEKDTGLFFRRHSTELALAEATAAQEELWEDLVQRDMLDQAGKNGRPNILFVSHYDFRPEAENHVGGIQLHVKDLVSHLKDDVNFICAARDRDCLAVTIYIAGRAHTIRYPISKRSAYPRWSDPLILAGFEDLLGLVRMDGIHVHSVYDMSFDIFDLATENGIPLYVTLHDYMYICPTIKMLDEERNICLPGGNCNGCMQAAMGITGGDTYVGFWRNKCAQYLAQAEHIIAPSDFVKETFEAVYPELAGHIQVIEHGLTPPTRKESVEQYLKPGELPQLVESADLRFYIEGCKVLNQNLALADGWAFDPEGAGGPMEVGVLATHGKRRVFKKGWASTRMDVADAFGENTLYSGFSQQIPLGPLALGEGGEVALLPMVFKGGDVALVPPPQQAFMLQVPAGLAARQAGKTKVAFIGNIDELKGSKELLAIARALPKEQFEFVVIGNIGDRELYEERPDNVVLAGKYSREELPAMLAFYDIDVVCILSMLIETFCYTLSEAWWQGLPVITTNVGAQGQRMRQHNGGWAVRMENAIPETMDVLLRIRQSPVELAEIKQAVRKIPMKTVADMAAEYRSLYLQAEGTGCQTKQQDNSKQRSS